MDVGLQPLCVRITSQLHTRHVSQTSQLFGKQQNAKMQRRGLRRGKGVLVDAGLQLLYVHAIRRAKKYLYIENQFFTGTPEPGWSAS